MPAHALPPMTVLFAAAWSAARPAFCSGCSQATTPAAPIAARRNPADTSIIAAVPSGSTSTLASHGPKMAPSVPPTAIAP